MIVLSVAPFTVIPPLFAVASDAPDASNVILPVVFAVVLVIDTEDDVRICVITVTPPNNPAPKLPTCLVSIIPGINPVTDVMLVITVDNAAVDIVPVIPVTADTDPNSILLSSTVNDDALIAVFPFTTNSPLTVTVPVNVGDTENTNLPAVPV